MKKGGLITETEGNNNAREPLPALISTLVTNQTQLRGQIAQVQTTYGRDDTDQVRLTILRTTQAPTATYYISIVTSMIQNNNQLTISYWKQTDPTFYSSSIPDGACG